MISKIISEKLATSNSIVHIIPAIVPNMKRESLDMESVKRRKRVLDFFPILRLMFSPYRVVLPRIKLIKRRRLRKTEGNFFELITIHVLMYVYYSRIQIHWLKTFPSV